MEREHEQASVRDTVTKNWKQPRTKLNLLNTCIDKWKKVFAVLPICGPKVKPPMLPSVPMKEERFENEENWHG